MKILQISAGPNPDANRSNGYLDALPHALAEIGHQVTCLHMAGFGPWHRGLHVDRTEGRIPTLTIRNSGIYAGLPPGAGQGTAQPERDIVPPARLRSIIRSILAERRPDAIHIQNLFGLPAGLLADLKSTGAPVILTVHDYSPICPTAHLFLPGGTNCSLARDELTCSRCCAASPPYALFRLTAALNQHIDRVPNPSVRRGVTARVRNALVRTVQGIRGFLPSDEPYRRRFDAMTSMLHQVDAVHCISQLQAQRLQTATDALPRLQVLPLVPPSVQQCGPVPRADVPLIPLRFAVLNVLPGRTEKGWDYLLAVLNRLEQRRRDFRVDWYADGMNTPCIHFRGRYGRADLDRIAAETDFCLIPSILHETLGFIGVEMLSRGVPLICSQRCGVAEAVEPGRTGFLFNPERPENLEQVIESVLDAPHQAAQCRSALAESCSHLPTFQAHVAAFAQLLERTASSRPSN